jgi:hypothetical protein
LENGFQGGNGTLITLQNKDYNSGCEIATNLPNNQKIKDLGIDKESQSNNLEFLNTLIRLKSSNDFGNSQNTNTFINNDESRLYLKELVDLCNLEKRQTANLNEITNNAPYEENLSFMQNKSNIANVNRTNKIQNNYNNLGSYEIINYSNPIKNPAISSISGYFNRRHTEELNRLEKLKKEKFDKEESEFKKCPQMNKNSKKIVGRLNSKLVIKPNNIIQEKNKERNQTSDYQKKISTNQNALKNENGDDICIL